MAIQTLSHSIKGLFEHCINRIANPLDMPPCDSPDTAGRAFDLVLFSPYKVESVDIYVNQGHCGGVELQGRLTPFVSPETQD
jgi:hypothetical protein